MSETTLTPKNTNRIVLYLSSAAVIIALLFIFSPVREKESFITLQKEADSLKREVRLWKDEYVTLSKQLDTLKAKQRASSYQYETYKINSHEKRKTVPQDVQDMVHSPVPDQLLWWRNQRDSAAFRE